MSFILDALRKSESERQRSVLPGVAQIPFAAPRPTLPRWAVGVIGALGLAVLGLAGAWWSTSRNPQPLPSVTAPVELPALRPAPDPALRATPPTVPATASAIASGGLPPGVHTPALERSGALAPPAGAVLASVPPQAEPAAVRSATAAPGAPPAPEPIPAVSAAALLPSATALAAEGIALPKLSLELHVFYRDRPADRLVIINGQRYREGATLREGPSLEAIDTAGAVLSYQGRRFLLTAE